MTNMKETATGKNVLKQSKDPKQASSTGLKSSMTLPKKVQNKECMLPRTLHKYTDLPSLRYGSTPTQNAFYARKTGPLRLSFGCESTCTKAKISDGGDLNRSDRYPSDENRNPLTRLNEDTATVRRVHFAELPPKNDCFDDCRDFNERRLDRGGEKEESENLMRRRIDISCTADGGGGDSVSSPQLARRGLSLTAGNFSFGAVKIADSKLGNNGESLGKRTDTGSSPLKDFLRGRHNGGKHRRGTLYQAPAVQLPAILRAAKDGNDDEVGEILRKAALFGITPEELNVTDGSGRTALSYIASNGSLKNLKSILKLPKLDVNKSDNEGNTPLHFASQAGQVEAINYMLSICPNVEIDARNALGFTPLMKAALQGRTKCAKLLLFAGASPNLKDSGRGLKAEQWAKFCGRHSCAEVIEKFARQKVTDQNGSLGKWESEPELIRNNHPQPSQIVPSTTTSNFKLKLRKAFRTTSHPGSDGNGKPFSVISQLTTVALCASSPVLQSSSSPSIKSLIRPLSVPKLEVTLASSYSNSDDLNSPIQHSSSEKSLKEKSTSSILLSRRKKKK